MPLSWDILIRPQKMAITRLIYSHIYPHCCFVITFWRRRLEFLRLFPRSSSDRPLFGCTSARSLHHIPIETFRGLISHLGWQLHRFLKKIIKKRSNLCIITSITTRVNTNNISIITVVNINVKNKTRRIKTLNR